MKVDILVVGAGINGLSTAWALLRRGVRVGLVEQFHVGHDRGSSHGASRITRSAYADPVYVRLMQVAHGEAWPRLEAEAGQVLVHKRDGCFFGPRTGKVWSGYADTVATGGVDVERIDVAEARRRFPAFVFDGDWGVLHDRTAGLVAAADTIAALARLVSARAQVWEETQVHAVDAAGAETSRGRIDAERVIVTAGSWTGRLLPRLAPALSPIRQTVAYLDLEGDHTTMPVWACLFDDPNDFYYGLPPFGRPGVKVARHRTSGRRDDPDEVAGEGDVADVRAFVAEHFAAPVRGVLATERCLYTCTDDEGFVLDVVEGITIGAGFSGHGFKFGPLTGQLLAELALDGRTTVPAFEEARARFRCAL